MKTERKKDGSRQIWTGNVDEKEEEPGYLSGTALGHGLDDWGIRLSAGFGNFLIATASRPTLGPTQPPIQCVSGAVLLG
jgi:hypothetical protein